MTFVREEVLFLDLRADGCRAEVFFNGLPLIQIGTGLPLRAGEPVLHHVVAGWNRLEVSISDVESVPGAGDPEGTPSSVEVLCRATWFRHGELADSDEFGDSIAELRVGPKDLPVPESSFVDFDGRDDRYRSGAVGPCWESADPIRPEMLEPDSDLLADAEAHFVALVAAFDRADVMAVMDLLGPFHEDYARAYPDMGLEGVAGGIRSILNVLKEEKGRPVLAPRSEWKPRLVAGGRLVEPRDSSGKPVLSFKFDSMRDSPYRLFFGRRGDRRLLVR